ncbi:EAL domain-containing protein [Thalassomonas actiniarum]|uniref:GGDEF domain-containing protein n=1 Tax=Thalassomonas actiniarum TaxID=485447 RepID=A0AAE9YMJ6_9GAMM|nr:GGDEF domain-containing protein [Thalassomonas actiniarum]WDD97636.1 GGDEF domain-containing protein [Thalassomonas actiniarum]
MYTFSQLLARNAVLGLLFCLVISSCSLFFLNKHFIQQQVEHQQVLTKLVARILPRGEIKDLTQILRTGFDYNLLTLSNAAGESLYHFTKAEQTFSLPLIVPDSHEFFLKQQNIKINFQLAADKGLLLIVKILLAILIATCIVIVIAGVLSTRRYKQFFASVSQQIKLDMSLFNPESKGETREDIFQIPALKQGIAEIKSLIEAQVAASTALEKEAYTDPLTQLNNRSRFIQYFESQLNQEGGENFGVLLITRCSELQTVNQIHGYHEGDNYIAKVAKIIAAALSSYPGAELFRLNSSDFASILPNVLLKEAEKFAQELTDKFNGYQQASDLDSVAYTGLVYFDQNKPLGELLALADTGISLAQTQGINAWFAQKDTDILKSASANYGNQNWRQEIDSVLENQRLSLFVQPIQPSSTNKVYGEVLARFLNANNEMLPTASFIAMAEKLDKIVAVDRLIVETAIGEISSKNLTEQSFGLNISSRSINDEHFLIWLERRLLREPAITSRLIFEISEYGLQQNIQSSKRFIDMVHRVGSRVTVEKFGVGLTSFKFFRDLKPDFIKMDSTYTRDIDEDKNNQYFLRLMVDLAHRLSISVLAESVESQEEKHALQKLFIDGYQGFYIGKPGKL